MAKIIREHIVKKVIDLISNHPQLRGEVRLDRFEWSPGPILGSTNRPIVIEMEALYDDYPAELKAVSEKALEALFGTSDQGINP